MNSCPLMLPDEALAPVSTTPSICVLTLNEPRPPGTLQTAGQKAKAKARESEKRGLRAEQREEVISRLIEKVIWEGKGSGGVEGQGLRGRQEKSRMGCGPKGEVGLILGQKMNPGTRSGEAGPRADMGIKGL